MNWAIVALTSTGAELGLKLQGGIPGSALYTMPGRGAGESREINGSLKEFTASILSLYDMIVFIMATGIVVRVIADLIKDKTTDPGILVMDEKGKFVISLLSGHMGGANNGAEYVAGLTGAAPVITTSSDVNGMLSPDMLAMKYGAVIDDMKSCKDITALMVNGGCISIHSEYQVDIAAPYVLNENDADGIIYFTNRVLKLDEKEKMHKPSLHLIPKNIVLGVGCRRDADPDALKDFISEELESLSIDRRSVCRIASIDIKSEEPAIKSASEFFNAETVFYPADRIREVEHMFECSDFVREKTGAGCVSEPCAYLATGCEGKSLLPKKKKNGMTLAIMERPIKEMFR